MVAYGDISNGARQISNRDSCDSSLGRRTRTAQFFRRLNPSSNRDLDVGASFVIRRAIRSATRKFGDLCDERAIVLAPIKDDSYSMASVIVPRRTNIATLLLGLAACRTPRGRRFRIESRRFRPGSGCATEQSFRAEIFVDVRPMDAVPAARDFPILS